MRFDTPMTYYLDNGLTICIVTTNRLHLPYLAKLENNAWPENPNESDLERFLDGPMRNGFTVLGKFGSERFYTYAGFANIQRNKRGYHIFDFVVGKRFRRQKVGMALINHIRNILALAARESDPFTGKQIADPDEKAVSVFVQETNLNGQLFLQKAGFVAEAIRKNAFGGRDAYLFRWELGNWEASKEYQDAKREQLFTIGF